MIIKDVFQFRFSKNFIFSGKKNVPQFLLKRS